MKIDTQTGLLQDAKILLSPNHDDRPDATDISGIVLHNISLPPGQFGGSWIDDLFLNRLDCSAHPYFAGLKDLQVSSHILIRRDGGVTQFVPFHKRAWHAGVSTWQGRERCNDFTIGIELEGCDDKAFGEAQYQSLVQLIKSLCDAYPALNYERITGHEHIAPGRKTDPGPCFDWGYLRALLA
ncbi:1,6-anhydro-N-acetylmuramyl-L-alanine amidase AmpD [Methylophaga sp. OBS4]|uniref:1,6-anhydro-N-acetylmuramyl-L-alanine amidase AmpD n=1 Tax=Methylophaga sp. OBS4 TaxID=2991935 RepID=UPI00224DB91C|nr:1,6-anhydro-N-acetylmuramyl-L-alanine amidase AmpD [Methylophaga sp. OBS4]MCX4187799.1 1,6-anhydro-N-acetylmuramyl-L-alanine amidase AmpD [Methylophaga sp. OBS4]